MKLETALALVLQLVERMRPFCERVKVAGSIRREKPEVKDIEVVAVPKWQEGRPAANTLFDVGTGAGRVNLLHGWALGSGIRWIKPGTKEVVDWSVNPEGKYWRGLLAEGVKLDLFLTRPDNFGLIYLIRTGSAEFTTAVVTHAKRVRVPCVDGYLRDQGEPIPTPEEEAVFDVLGLRYVEPRDRIDGRALTVVKPRSPKT